MRRTKVTEVDEHANVFGSKSLVLPNIRRSGDSVCSLRGTSLRDQNIAEYVRRLEEWDYQAPYMVRFQGYWARKMSVILKGQGVRHIQMGARCPMPVSVMRPKIPSGPLRAHTHRRSKNAILQMHYNLEPHRRRPPSLVWKGKTPDHSPSTTVHGTTRIITVSPGGPRRNMTVHHHYPSTQISMNIRYYGRSGSRDSRQ